MSPGDVGQATLGDDGTMTLTSSGDSRLCPAGSSVVLGDVEAAPTQPLQGSGLVFVLTGEADEADAGGCALHDGLGGEWLSVS